MIAYPNGTRYLYTDLYEDSLNKPYDYRRNGLLKHLMSSKIVETKNTITRYILSTFENSIVMVLKLTDVLANFKNPYFKNR